MGLDGGRIGWYPSVVRPNRSPSADRATLASFAMKVFVSSAVRRPRCHASTTLEDRSIPIKRVRVAPEHDELIRQASDSAARRRGSGDMSSWIRETLVAAARRELKRGEGEE